jgi:uncharacterized protein YwgA
MQRLKRSAILISLIENLRGKGSWCGETHIQKSTYFLQKLFDIPLEHEFILYKYGPYSFDLTDELSAMKADLLVRQELCPPYGPSILPGQGWLSIKERFPKTISMYKDQIEFIADKLGNQTASELERLATALYVTLDSNVDRDRRADEVRALKPHVSKEDATEAVRFVDKMIIESEEVAA